jgi:hypothetical protein
MQKGGNAPQGLKPEILDAVPGSAEELGEKARRKGGVCVARLARVEAHTHFAEVIGPPEVVPLLQSLFD